MNPENELILYTSENGKTRLECRFQEKTLWLSLNQIAELFGRDKSVISKHLKNIFEEGELERNSVVANHATTARDGKTYKVDFYHLDAQNKMHWAAHDHTAAEIIYHRVDAQKPHLGLTQYKGAGPTKKEVVAAKNYLSEDELNLLNRIVTAYLEFAEIQALKRRPMRMTDWIKKLDSFLELGDHEVLTNAGKISAAQAKERAYLEYDKFRKVIDIAPTQVDKDLQAVLKKLPKPPKT